MNEFSSTSMLNLHLILHTSFSGQIQNLMSYLRLSPDADAEFADENEVPQYIINALIKQKNLNLDDEWIDLDSENCLAEIPKSNFYKLSIEERCNFNAELILSGVFQGNEQLMLQCLNVPFKEFSDFSNSLLLECDLDLIGRFEQTFSCSSSVPVTDSYIENLNESGQFNIGNCDQVSKMKKDKTEVAIKIKASRNKKSTKDPIIDLSKLSIPYLVSQLTVFTKKEMIIASDIERFSSSIFTALDIIKKRVNSKNFDLKDTSFKNLNDCKLELHHCSVNVVCPLLESYIHHSTMTVCNTCPTLDAMVVANQSIEEIKTTVEISVRSVIKNSP